MNDLLISVSTAIEQIDTAVTAKGNKGVIGYVLRKCKLFDLSLYQIDQKTNQAKQVNSIISELFYEYFRDKYPPRPKEKVKNMLDIIQPYVMTYTYTEEPFNLSEYFWYADDFKNNTQEIFNITDTPAISYQISQDVQELQAQIQDLQQQLQEAQARIKELESTQNAGVNDELKGLQKVNYDTERTRKFAQIIARTIWDMDKTQAIRTNGMVQFLKPLIAEFEPSKLPDNDETVSDWLANIKPSHATKSGRPLKNEPLEIPLTFKK